MDRTVWGVDWNHALDGPEHAGSRAGREAIEAALVGLDLTAVGTPVVRPAERVVIRTEGRRLSDHDAYVVEVSFAR